MDQRLIEGLAVSLKELASRGGEAALLDERRVRGKLADSHPEDVAARNSVIEALKLGIPTRLAKTDAALLASTLNRESEKLRRQFAIDPVFARGAVRTWAIALGLPLGSCLSQDGAGEADGSSGRPERIVRCAEGHVFDSALGRCPVCGWTKSQDLRGRLSMSLRDLVFSDRSKNGRFGSVRRPSNPIGAAAAGAFVIAVAVVAYLYVRPPAPQPFNANDPLTWPVGAGQAALWPRSDCSRGWTSTPLGCLKSGKNLGPLSAMSYYHLPSDTALFFAVMGKTGTCPPGTALESPGYCLTEALFPGETTIDLVSNPNLLSKTHLHCNPFSQLDIPLEGYCLAVPKSPALRGPWHLTHAMPAAAESLFGYPSVLKIEGPKQVCPDNALLQNDVGFCLVSS